MIFEYATTTDVDGGVDGGIACDRAVANCERIGGPRGRSAVNSTPAVKARRGRCGVSGDDAVGDDQILAGKDRSTATADVATGERQSAERNIEQVEAVAV